MVGISEILLPKCTGEGCSGETGTCTESRVHRRNAENRAPATRNHRQAQPLVNNLYQGMTLDAVTGLYYQRERDYSPSLGRWMEQDPAQFINGANTYQFVDSSPVGKVDAEGLAEWIPLDRVVPGVTQPAHEINPNGQEKVYGNGGGAGSHWEQLTPGGPGPMPTSAPPWDLNMSAWENDAWMLTNWAFGIGPRHLYFGPRSLATKQMEQSPGVQAAITMFYAKNHGVACCRNLRSYTGFGYHFGVSNIFQSNATEQFVGSYTVNIYPNTVTGVVTVDVWNNTSMKSLLYGIGPAWQRSSFRPGGNMAQTYWWTFKYPCRK